MAVNQLSTLSALPSPPNRFVGDQERFDEMAFQSLKAQEKMVNEDLNKTFIPALNRFAVDVNTSVEDAARSELNAGTSADSASVSAGAATVKAAEAALSAESSRESAASARTAWEMADLAALAARRSKEDADASAAVAKREKEAAVVASRLAEDAARHVLNATGGVMADRLAVLSLAATHAWLCARRAVASYKAWKRIDSLTYLAMLRTAADHADIRLSRLVAAHIAWKRHQTACLDTFNALLAFNNAVAHADQGLLAALDRHEDATALSNLLRSPGRSSTPLLFFVLGQSNAYAHAPVYESAADCAWKFNWVNEAAPAFAPFREPMHHIGSTGGAGGKWPLFCKTLFRLTGRRAYMVNLSKGSSIVVNYTGNSFYADGDLHWNPEGNLRGIVQTQRTNAMNWLAANNITYELGGVLWIQGENDGSNINAGAYTLETYVAGLESMYAWVQALFGEGTPFIMSQTGEIRVSAEPAEAAEKRRSTYAALQAAQLAFCMDAASHPHAHIAFTGAKTFFANGCMRPDMQHYNLRGDHMMSRSLAHYYAHTINV